MKNCWIHLRAQSFTLTHSNVKSPQLSEKRRQKDSFSKRTTTQDHGFT